VSIQKNIILQQAQVTDVMQKSIRIKKEENLLKTLLMFSVHLPIPHSAN